jgi:hypothetical protein
MENMLALIPSDKLARKNRSVTGGVLTSQLLGLSICSVTLNRGKVKVAFGARDKSAVY